MSQRCDKQKDNCSSCKYGLLELSDLEPEYNIIINALHLFNHVVGVVNILGNGYHPRLVFSIRSVRFVFVCSDSDLTIVEHHDCSDVF